MPLFGRKATLKAGTLSISGLDLRFKVFKTDQPEPNKAEIVIYNLGENSREQLESDPDLEVELFVGYTEADVEGVIFRGDVQEVFSQHSAPDWVTTLHTGDGDKQTRRARLNTSYPAGTSFSTMWRDAVNALKDAGLGGGNATAAFNNAAFKDGVKQYLHGAVASGPAFLVLKRMAKSAGLDVHINDKELVVTKNGEPIQASVISLGSTTGLIGSPERGVNGELRCKALLIPDLYPKRKINLESRQFNGTYVINKATYSGDLAGSEWYVDLECTEVA